MADLLVSGGIVAALEQAAVTVGRRVDLFRLTTPKSSAPRECASCWPRPPVGRPSG